MMRCNGRIIGVWGLLLITLVIGGALRFQSLDWDEGAHQHPDERYMTMVASALEMPSSPGAYFSPEASPCNPARRGYAEYAYGTAPLFLARWLGERIGYTDYQHVYMAGRAMSAGLDLLTVLLVFLTGRLFLSRGYAVLGAAFYALTTASVQHAHFFTVDSSGTLMITVFLYACLRMLVGGRLVHGIVAGLSLGVAAACRINLLLYAPFAVLVLLLMLKREGEPVGRGVVRVCAGFFLLVVFAALAFRVAQPYAFEGWWRLSGRWLEAVERVVQISQGRVDVPYTHQWAGRMRWVFPWINQVRWGMGWGLGLTAWAGVFSALGAALFRVHRRLPRETTCTVPALLAVWVLWGFFWHGREYLMTMRYFLPVYPALAVLASGLLMQADGWIRRTARPGFRWTAHVPGLLILVLTAGWVLAFSAIYHRPHTRVAASRWMVRALPAKSAVACEHWDDELPLYGVPPGEAISGLRRLSLPLYEPDTPEKLEQVLRLLDRTDFVVLSSDRLIGSIPRLPSRYPMTTRYYEALLDGTLGFDPVAEFVSYPSLGGYVFEDSASEEAFQVYDHPRVRIFSRTPRWDRMAAAERLSAGVDWAHVDRRSAFQIGRGAGRVDLTDDQRQRVRHGGTWSAVLDPDRGLFHRDDGANRYPVLTWLLMLELSAWMVFPLMFRLFGGFPDRGWLAARVAAPVLFTGVVWWLTRCGVLVPQPAALRILFGMGLLTAAVAYAVSRSLRAAVRAQVRLMLAENVLYWVVFGLFLLLRFSNPDLWHPWFGGEKPMDFAFLNAVIKSPFYPPYNPWCSGEYINYYYMGFVMCSVWVKLSGVIPSVAYNLLIPTMAANTAVAAFCAGGMLLNGTLARGNGAKRQGIPFSRAVYWVGGTASAFLAVFSGNLYEWLLLLRDQVPDWDWFWAASRAIFTPEGDVPPITEFPFFTFLYGDLHAHMMNMPLFLLNLLLAAALLSRKKNMGWITVFAALNLGMMYTVNAWDFPAGVLLMSGAFFFRCREGWGRRVWSTLWYAAGLAAASVLFFFPFHVDYQAGYGAFTWWKGARTGVRDYLLIYGVLLTPPLLFFVRWAVNPHRRRAALARYPLAGLWATLAVLSLGMGAGVEFLVLEGDIGRMNTVFKFYIQIWLLLAVFSGACVGLSGHRAVRRTRSGRLVLAGCLLLVPASLFYAWKAVPARARCRFEGAAPLTLDGQAFMQEGVYPQEGRSYALNDDGEAIRWMQEHVAGTPVLVEAHLPEYGWGSRYSIHTGLPTLLGWSWHQRQQHAGQPDWIVAERARDVAEIYTTPSLTRAWDLMRKYGAEYLVVGPAERAAYPDSGLTKFGRTNAFWSVVYRNPGVTLYRLDDRP